MKHLTAQDYQITIRMLRSEMDLMLAAKAPVAAASRDWPRAVHPDDDPADPVYIFNVLLDFEPGQSAPFLECFGLNVSRQGWCFHFYQEILR